MIKAVTLLAALALSAAALADVPAPPSQLCIDNRCSTTPPTEPAGGALDWHPGHYIAAAMGTDSRDVTTVVNFVNQRSYLRGVVLRIFWADLESSQGNYTFGLIDQALNELNKDKYVWVHIQGVDFGGDAVPSNVCPQYLLSSAYGGGCIQTGDRAIALVWNPAVMDRKIALVQALANRYNNTAQFEGIVISETATGLTNNEAGTDYNPADFAEQLIRLMPVSRAAFSKKQLLLYINFISGTSGGNYFQAILDAARKADYVVGGPDSLYLNESGGREYIDGTRGTTDYRGKIGIQVGDQSSGLSNSSYVVSDLIKWGIEQKANYFFWQYLPNARNFDPILNHVASNPSSSYVAAYPSEFPE